MRAGAALLLLAALVVSSCGASHRTDASHRIVKTRSAPSEPKNYRFALISRSGAVRKVSDLPVGSAVADGRGGWFVAGDFGLARLRPDGKLDSAWGTSASRNLIGCRGRLVKSGSRLYIPGSQPNAAAAAVGENGPCGIEAFDAGTGARLWVSPSFAQAQNPIYALTASPTRVYVAGAFTSVGNVKRQFLAALDANTGRLLAWRGPRFSFNLAGSTNVSALTLAGSRLYVGGLFESVDGKRRYYLAALNPSTGALLPWKPPQAVSGAYVPFEILVTRGQLLVPGEDGFAAVDLGSGRAPSWPSRIRGGASRLATDGPLLYLGANIEHSIDAVDGAPRNNLAVFNLATKRFTSWAPDLAPFTDVGEIVPSGRQVLVVGYFTDSIG